jgi:hypothetical protein
MRPGQQKQRGRGRNGGGNPNNNNNNNSNNNQRKGQNPLTRTYDSSGPDVKIRGTAQHIAEKYMALARDATSSGDRVMAENYLQHAEHYNRIIAAAQAMFQERFQRDERDDRADASERDEDDGDAVQNQNHHQHQNYNQQQPDVENEAPKPAVVQQPALSTIDENTPQPVFDETPAEVQIEQEAAAAGDSAERTPRRRSNAGRPRRQPRQPREEKSETEAAAAPVEEPAE